MDKIDSVESENCEKSPVYGLKTSELVEMNNTLSNSAPNLKDGELSNNSKEQYILQREQNVLENFEKPKIDESNAIHSDVIDTIKCNDGLNNHTSQKNSSVLDIPVPFEKNNSNLEDKIEKNTSSDKLSVAVIKTLRPLCADYTSDSESESVDSDIDSSTVLASSTTDSSSEDEYTSDGSSNSVASEKEKISECKKVKKELSLIDLPPIEELKISVPEDACVEIGTITSIVDTLVVVESYKGTAALDLETVLFLDWGKRTLGKVFDVLGPVTEPVYTVRFNSQEQMKNLNIEKNMKVFYAPKTPHTTFVFMSEVLKNKGSDASWKDNTEAPPEFQDFSDDEQERLHRNKKVRETEMENSGFKEQRKPRKRVYNNVQCSSRVPQTPGFRNPNFSMQRRPNIQSALNSQPALPFLPSSSGHLTVFDPIQTSPLPCNVPPHVPSMNTIPVPPRVYFPSRFSGFPMFGGPSVFNQSRNFQHPFHQPRTPEYLQTSRSWGQLPRPMFGYHIPPPPPPPPPPPSEQGDHWP